MAFDRFFGEEPARDGYERVGRGIGTVVGIAIMVAMTWVALRG
jgi:hypothetical protein